MLTSDNCVGVNLRETLGGMGFQPGWHKWGGGGGDSENWSVVRSRNRRTWDKTGSGIRSGKEERHSQGSHGSQGFPTSGPEVLLGLGRCNSAMTIHGQFEYSLLFSILGRRNQLR